MGDFKIMSFDMGASFDKVIGFDTSASFDANFDMKTSNDSGYIYVVNDNEISSIRTWSSEKIHEEDEALKAEIDEKLDAPPENGQPGLALMLDSEGNPQWADAVAESLKTPREIRLSGNVSGAAMFDGSHDVEIYSAVSTLTNEELEEMLQL